MRALHVLLQSPLHRLYACIMMPLSLTLVAYKTLNAKGHVLLPTDTVSSHSGLVNAELDN